MVNEPTVAMVDDRVLVVRLLHDKVPTVATLPVMCVVDKLPNTAGCGATGGFG